MPFDVHVAAVTFAEAAAQCEALSTQLARVDSAVEQAELEATLDATAGASSRSYWIGASDSVEDGTFLWRDGTPVSYSLWGPNQPIDAGNEDCVGVIRSATNDKWEWFDAGCEQALNFKPCGGFVCSPLSPPVPPASPSPPFTPPSPPLSPPAPMLPGATTFFVLSTSFSSPDPGPRRWESARAWCEGRGLQLAVVSTAANQAAFEAAAADVGLAHAMFWLGARAASAGSLDYSWVDGTPLNEGYTNWATSRPAGRNECVVMYQPKEGWRWNNGYCDGPRSFACSSLPPPPSPPAQPPSPPAQPALPAPAAAACFSAPAPATLEGASAQTAADGGTGLTAVAVAAIGAGGTFLFLLLLAGAYVGWEHVLKRRQRAASATTFTAYAESAIADGGGVDDALPPPGPTRFLAIVNPGEPAQPDSIELVSIARPEAECARVDQL